MNLPTITKDNNCISLTQDLWGMDLYERSKAIVDFCNKETKLFEKEIDRLLLSVFERNGVNIYSTDKSVLKQAFDTLKANGKTIRISDLFKDIPLYDTEIVKETKNHFMVVLESKRYLQCGVHIQEIKL